jgi:hypothetical protein
MSIAEVTVVGVSTTASSIAVKRVPKVCGIDVGDVEGNPSGLIPSPNRYEVRPTKTRNNPRTRSKITSKRF